MITNAIIKLVAGENPDYKNIITRTKLGSAAGFVGIITNVSLTLIKGTIGFASGSISVVADALNNLTDTASSIVSLVGLRLAGKAKDQEHPYGHGRGEYVATLIVALGILFVGVSLLKSSVENIINPKLVDFNWLSFGGLILSISVKYWMYFFYKNVGQKIESTTLKAASIDSLGDVLVTAIVVLSFLLSSYTDLPVDGIGGVLVSLFILKSGYDLISETISDILGVGPSQEFIGEIEELFSNRENILGTHDLQIYDYGQGVKFATIDVLVNRNSDIVCLHNIFTEIEHEILDRLGVMLTIHMDVDAVENEEEKILRKELDEYIKLNDKIVSYHDNAILEKNGEKHIMLHLVTDGKKILTNEDEEKEVKKLIKYLEKNFNCKEFNVIVDKEYEERKEKIWL